MFAFSGSLFAPSRLRLSGPVAVLFLAACATTPPRGSGQPSATERVETGYGSVEKDHMAGSPTTFEGEDLHKGQPGTLAEMLARLPGVRVIDMVDVGMSVRIRGSASFVGGEEPLFVIDGMPIQSADGALNSINPSTVKSIRVLKDAEATAIYGSRGANGVILIQTTGG